MVLGFSMLVGKVGIIAKGAMGKVVTMAGILRNWSNVLIANAVTGLGSVGVSRVALGFRSLWMIPRCD